MIQLPSLRSLDVDDYALYPGTDRSPGLHVEFRDGLTIVLGANGLGKTTLVTIAYRMLVGPVDIPGMSDGGRLGNRSLEHKGLSSMDRRVFAERVLDGAADSVATLTFNLGASKMSVSRSLRTLEVQQLIIDGQQVSATQSHFEDAIIEKASLAHFADWILALRHLVFYFEDRKALVWDSTAQRQLLRLLFLPPEQALKWRKQERQVLELDSLVRNLMYSLNKESRLVGKATRALGTADEIRQALSLLTEAQDRESLELEECNDLLVDLAAARQTARVNALNAEQTYDSAVRDLERQQLEAVNAAFPDATVTSKYILGQLLADGICVTCNNLVPDFRDTVSERLRSNHCPICNAVRRTTPKHVVSVRRLKKADEAIEAAFAQRHSMGIDRTRVEKQYDELVDRVSDLNDRVARRAQQIKEHIRRLPTDEKALHDRQNKLESLSSLLEQRRSELAGVRLGFSEFVAGVNRSIAEQKEAIKGAFDAYATGFLIEECRLTWAPVKERVGETGAAIEFANFELEMTGGAFVGTTRRNGPSHVSESQREFIDLSFRMALMEVASDHGGTLIIDAPESSLDAVFVTRAADVLIRFGNAESGNRLIVTSNLIEGNLIPELLAKSGIMTARSQRVLDLLRVAAPTAATTLLRSEYEAVRTRLFEQAAARA